MKTNISLENILFLDIETVPNYASWELVPDLEKKLFEKKTAYQRRDEIQPSEFYERAGIWAEFGKIICISVAYFHQEHLRVRSFASHDEKKLLQDFQQLLNEHFNKNKQLLCAHNGKEFDFPYIARRMIFHQINLPEKLNLFGKKPWEVPHLDTMEMWKFGDYKNFTSLQLLCYLLGIPSPKDDMDGSDVAKVYYTENNLEKIIEYCENDTIAVAQLLLRFMNKTLLESSQIIRK